MFYFSDSLAFGGLKHRKQLIEDGEEDWVTVNVSKTSFDTDDYHIPLNDGAYDGGNSPQDFAEAVNAVREHIQSSEQVFVHCAVGQSRSVSVLATAIAAEDNREFDAVRDELMDIRGSFTEPANSLQSKARTYLRHSNA